MKFFIKTLGCDKNTCDSENLAGLLISAGHKQTDNADEADIIVVNTCGFINDAKQQSIESIFDYALNKKDSQKLIVSGCLSQRYAVELKKEIPEADFFFGVNDYEKFLEIFDAPDCCVYNGNAPKEYIEFGKRVRTDTPWTAPLKISEGCRNVCTYCAIPMIRGGFRSRKPSDIINEAKLLAAQGCKELLIVAQDVTNYGEDFRKKGTDLGTYQSCSNLPGLLKELVKVDGIEWIRLMYCYEDEITDDLIRLIKTEPKICKYLDIPLQHCSDKILKAMNRRSTSKSIKFTVNKLRKLIPGIVIRTTFICGFPGETKAEFKELYNFVEETQFDRLGVFAYSKEEGTKAAKMEHQVKQDAKERRRDKIMALQQGISLQLNQKYIGSVQRVIVDEDPQDGTYLGRTQFDAPDIDNGVIFTSELKHKPGDMVNVLIQDAFDYDLSGKEVL